MAPTGDLIKYMLVELYDRSFEVTKTALVKLLYLADVEAVRQGSPRVSEIEWISYKYGPYAFGIDDALKRLSGREIDELTGVSALGKTYYLYRLKDYEELPGVGPEQRAIVNRVLDRWGGESLENILNYVYFETEPMLEAEWAEPLDFATIRKREPSISLAEYLARRLSAAETERLVQLKQAFRAKARASKASSIEPLPRPRYDEVFLEGMRVADQAKGWNEE